MIRRLLAPALIVVFAASLTWFAQSGVADATGGTWIVSSTPSPSGSDVTVEDVSCASLTDCTAVGRITSSGPDEMFSMRWDGSNWLQVAMPDIGPGNTTLKAVSCPFASFCVAVGTYYDSATQRFSWFPVHWDGTTWSVLAATQAGNSHNFVSDVSCAGASSCVAVGHYLNGGPYSTHVQRWNGTAWSADASPNGGSSSASNLLSGVSCASATDCMAVGWRVDGASNTTTAIRWDGSSWSSTSPTNAGGTATFLKGVWCRTPIDCVAVGMSTGATNDNFVTRWDGASWATEAVPNAVPGAANLLYAVSCTGPTSCIAVGRSLINSNYVGTILEFDGSSWTVPVAPVAAPNEDVELLAVSCPAPGSCAAVGYTTANMAADYLSLGLWSIPAPTPPTAPVVGPAYTG